MSWQNLLNQVLDAGQKMAQQGQGYVEDKLNVPASGDARQASFDGMKTGAVAAGALALLLGTKTGRKVGNSALKLGSAAAVGGLAYQAYKKWQENQVITEKRNNDADMPALLESDQNQQDQHSLILLKAMLAAASADGHIDETEMQQIRQHLGEIQADVDLDVLLFESANAESVAAMSDSLNLSMQIYLVSSLVLDKNNAADQVYRQALITALQLSDEMVQALEVANQNSEARIA